MHCICLSRYRCGPTLGTKKGSTSVGLCVCERLCVCVLAIYQLSHCTKNLALSTFCTHFNANRLTAGRTDKVKLYVHFMAIPQKSFSCELKRSTGLAKLLSPHSTGTGWLFMPHSNRKSSRTGCRWIQYDTFDAFMCVSVRVCVCGLVYFAVCALYTCVCLVRSTVGHFSFEKSKFKNWWEWKYIKVKYYSCSNKFS